MNQFSNQQLLNMENILAEAMEIPVNYNSKNFKDKWYNYWQENGYFWTEIDDSKKPYTILLPPPNRSGVLHLGHAINSAFQDIFIRYKKFKGFNTLFIPGTDHGGISTEQMVKKHLCETEE